MTELSSSQRQELEAVLATLKAADASRRYRSFELFKPYPKQQEFFALGKTKRERLLIAGNQLGKSQAGAYEMALHLTGQYPKNWAGRKFDHPVKAWAIGETSLVTRDVSQKKLCGEPGVIEDFGTGMIPLKSFEAQPTMSRGVTDAIDTIFVIHETNGVQDGVSICRFKSYEQGRQKMQGDTIDLAWCDEEPPLDIYTEVLTRTNATGGMVYITFTPLKGRSDVVLRFLDEANPDRGYVTMTIYDVKHISPEEREKIIASYPIHERDARIRGVPMLGSGRIFPYSDESIMEAPLDYLPPHWGKLWGIDFGIDHPFAAVLAAWDRDNDVLHIMHTIRVSDQLPLQHASAMKKAAAGVPVSWPHDGDNRDKGTGMPLSRQYKAQGLVMLPSHAQFVDGSNSTEAGVLEMQERMVTGRLKVASHLSDWLQEFRMYHRKDGMIVKLEDDLMSATRMIIMDKRHARAGSIGPNKVMSQVQFARDIDFDLS